MNLWKSTNVYTAVTSLCVVIGVMAAFAYDQFPAYKDLALITAVAVAVLAVGLYFARGENATKEIVRPVEDTGPGLPASEGFNEVRLEPSAQALRTLVALHQNNTQYLATSFALALAETHAQISRRLFVRDTEDLVRLLDHLKLHPPELNAGRLLLHPEKVRIHQFKQLALLRKKQPTTWVWTDESLGGQSKASQYSQALAEMSRPKYLS